MNLVNFRDLGGIKAKDGRRIKPCRLLRSAELSTLEYDTMQTLKKTYNLRHVIDLRNVDETCERPNVEIEGVNNQIINILENLTHTPMKVTTEGLTQQLAYNHMINFYTKLVSAKDKYRKFLNVIINNNEGAVLFHCAQGKDRTGMVAAIILYSLGVSKEDIYKDYMQTIALRKQHNEIYFKKLKNLGYSSEKIEGANVLLNVQKSFLDHAFKEIEDKYINMQNYVENELKLSKEEIEILREMYLQ